MPIKIIIEPFDLSNKSAIESKWQALEKNANTSVFLSWLWIGNWLDVVTDKLFIIKAYRKNEVVGLGFFVEKTRKVFGFLPIKQWWLHKTGIQQQDQIWVEYNDFLLDKSCAKVAREKMIESLSIFDSSIKEVIVGLATPETLNCFNDAFEKLNFLEASREKVHGYLISFASAKNDFLNKVLSKNTRSQISRSKKLLNSNGNLSFKVITNPKDIARLYPEIESIHIERWKHTPEGSGFLNPVFKKFHQAMLADNTNNSIQISILSLNEEKLGYLINFVYNNVVYFYLSALKKYSDNRIKIGLTLHSEAIQYYISQGINSYDFLGGDSRYKRSLSDQTYSLEMKCYYRNDLILLFERKLKKFKAKILSGLTRRSKLE